MDTLQLTHTRPGDGQTSQIQICGRLAIDTAAELHVLLRSELETANRLTLDLSALETMDLTGIQLLCSACRTATSTGKRFDLSPPPSTAVRQLIVELGLQRYTTCKHNTDIPCIWHQGAH